MKTLALAAAGAGKLLAVVVAHDEASIGEGIDATHGIGGGRLSAAGSGEGEGIANLLTLC